MWWRLIRLQIAALVFASLIAPVAATEVTLRADGADTALEDALRGASASVAAGAAEGATPQDMLAAARADYRTMLQVLYGSGFFGPEISIKLDGQEANQIAPLAIPTTVSKVDIRIVPGPAFRFGRASAGPLATGTQLPPEFATDAPATTGAVQAAARAAREGWREAGHAKVDIARQSITARHPEARLDADLRLNPGPRLTFGDLAVSGNTDVRTEAIQRIAGLPTGDTFHPDALSRAASRLRRTGAFRSVALTEAEAIGPDQTLPITVDVEEELARRFRFGGELSSRTGLSITVGWLHRNLAGNAERLSIEGQSRNIGGTEDIDGRFSIRLDQPARLGPDDNVFLLADLERLSRPHFDLNRIRAGIGVTRDLGDGLTGSLSLETQVADADDAFGERRFRTLSLPFRLTRDRRDVAQDATRGYFLEGEVIPFAGLGGTESGISAGVEARGYVPLGSTFVFAGRARLASVAGPGLSEVSPALLHFSGGAGSVRGHPFQSLGIAVGGEIAGGRSLFVANAELRARINETWGLAGFYDFGLVDSDSVPGSGSRSHSGVGIGIRYTAGGFGPIRLDLAVPLTGDTDDGLQFYIGIGQAF